MTPLYTLTPAAQSLNQPTVSEFQEKVGIFVLIVKFSQKADIRPGEDYRHANELSTSAFAKI